LSISDVEAGLRSLAPAGIVYERVPKATIDPAEIRTTFKRACQIWSTELQLSYIGNEFVHGRLPYTVLLGWLIEMYHYIEDFPRALQYGSQFAKGKLKEILTRYANEEFGHERFVLETLVNLGVTAAEVKTSVPLLSTRLVGFLMRELFQLEPSSSLLVAAVLEARDFNKVEIEGFKKALHQHYGLDRAAFDPYFAHQQIDVRLGHASLLESNTDLITVDDPMILDQLTNKLHDLKHAFDLQGLEIKHYFEPLNGKYVPRQPVAFDSI
jgi:hypothetical protein